MNTEVSSGQAQNISGAKSRVAYILLGLTLGILGIHNFYAGYNKKAVTQLLISVLLCWTVIAPTAVGIWCIVDVCTVTKDAQGRPFS
ncbi:MAG: NINE protein [Chloroflexi bacterium]|nr:NINE protein [Chloroflexota bacterium]